MNRQKIILGLLLLLVLVLTILFISNRKQINERNNEISDLEDKVNTLESKVSELEDEKEELESKVSNLPENQEQSYQPNITIPNLQTNPPSTFNKGGQTTANTGIAIVVYKSSSCDYFILENASGYIVAEWMGGNDPDLGDRITGNFNSFGTKEFFNQTRDRDSRLWIDDYMLSKESALDKIREQCE